MKILLSILLFTTLTLEASTSHEPTFVETKVTLETKTGKVFGTLTAPEKFSKIPVALIIGGSGPTDRDGNNPMMINNSLKMLSTELSKSGIATLRYDKRGIGESKDAMKNEADLRFDDYVNDAKEWILKLKQDKRFSKVIVIGHSEGSLIGMLAATNADKFISIAGAGQSADKTLREQLNAQPQFIQDLCFPIIDSLKNGKTVENVNPMLSALFRLGVQPYIISWFKYDPQTEIKKLSIPTLIIQGTNDIQISTEDANRLLKAKPDAKLILIDKMNHIFRIVEGDRDTNMATYNNASLPLAGELTKCMANFILKQ
jgi:uncharacterized protein